jgi:AbrB family transcriptional regulator, transcriptional pleiotropic regulator of transition state genes
VGAGHLIFSLAKAGVTKKMKSTGVIRRVDQFGRVVLPVELRRVLGMQEMEFYVDKERVVLKRHDLYCTFCNSVENITSFHKRGICQICLADIHSKYR